MDTTGAAATAPAVLTIKQLQARLVRELGEEYRVTRSTIAGWIRRDRDPLPVVTPGKRGGPETTIDWDACLEWLEREAERREAQTEGGISTTKDGILVTLRAMARELGMHVDTLTARIRAWNLHPVARRDGTGRPADLYRLREILEALTASAATEDPDTLPATERDAHYRAELRKDEVRRSRRELIEVDEARNVMGQLIAVRRDFYDLLPDMLEHHAGLTPAALELVQSQIDTCRALEVERLMELRASLSGESPQAEAA